MAQEGMTIMNMTRKNRGTDCIKGTPATGLLSDGQDSMMVPQTLESTQSYKRSNSKIHSQARVEEQASHSPAIQRGSDHIACAEIAQPVEEVRNRCNVTFLLSGTASGINANAQRVNLSRGSSINSSPKRLTPNPEKIDHSLIIQRDSNHTKHPPPSRSTIVLSKDQ